MNANKLEIFVVLGESLKEARYNSRDLRDSDESGWRRNSYVNSIKMVEDKRLEFKKLNISQKTKISELIKILGLKAFVDNEYTEYIITYAYVVKRTQFSSSINCKNRDEANKHHNSTIGDLGITNGEVIILDKAEIERRSTGNIVMYDMMAPPRTVDLFALVKNSLPEKSEHLHMVILYTDADIELARFIRESYADLHILSGKSLHVYALENLVIEDNITEHLKYWRSMLSEKLYVVWAALGWLSTKPYDKTQCYEIGKRLGVAPERFPCAVLFDVPSPDRALIFPMNRHYIDFFRTLFSELNKIIDTINPKSNSDEENIALKNYPGEDIENKQGLYEKVKREYQKIKDEILATAKSETTNEFIFHGKTVFINNPTGDIKLSNFQND